jgi:hypothetical protein
MPHFAAHWPTRFDVDRPDDAGEAHPLAQQAGDDPGEKCPIRIGAATVSRADPFRGVWLDFFPVSVDLGLAPGIASPLSGSQSSGRVMSYYCGPHQPGASRPLETGAFQAALDYEAKLRLYTADQAAAAGHAELKPRLCPRRRGSHRRVGVRMPSQR